MIFGVQFWNFKVRYAVKGNNATIVQACAQQGRGNTMFVVLENKDAAIEKLSPNQLKALYTFFTGKELKPFPRYLMDVYPKVKKAFDEEMFEKAAGFKIPKFKDDEEPLEVSVAKSKVREADYPELKNTGPEPYNPATDRDRSTNPEETETKSEEEDTEMAATKKTASKKSAKKAPAKKGAAKKAAPSGAGRKSPYEPTAKLYPIEKENPCNPMFAGKPGQRHKCMQIVLDKPGITYEDFLKKGGTLNDLQGLAVRKKYVRVSK